MAELIVALDSSDLDRAAALVKKLQGRVTWFKIGLELFSHHGPQAVRRIRSLGARVFLDLKFLDIPNTVRAAARAAARSGADMFTVHLSGGQRMVQAACLGRDEGAPTGTATPLLVGVTLLTSLDRTDIAWMGEHDPADLVLRLADAGRDWGVDGVVCSALELGKIKQRLGPSVICVTPGIRMSTDPGQSQDQSRIATPNLAVADGAEFLVVGRPITTAADPVAAANAFLAAMTTVHQGAGE